MSDTLKELLENPEYQRILSEMSDEERKIAEKAAKDLILHFEQKILDPLKNSLKK